VCVRCVFVVSRPPTRPAVARRVGSALARLALILPSENNPPGGALASQAVSLESRRGFHIIERSCSARDVCRYSSHEPRAGVTAERAAVPRHPADIQSDFEHHPCVINMRRACAAVSVVLCSEMGAVMGVVMGVVLGVVLGVSSLS